MGSIITIERVEEKGKGRMCLSVVIEEHGHLNCDQFIVDMTQGVKQERCIDI
jgi:hypothetical protein